MNLKEIDLQIAVSDKKNIPAKSQFKTWLSLTDHLLQKNTEVTIRIVEDEEIKLLNNQFRYKNKSTNILSFPCDLYLDEKIPINLIGDLIICKKSD